MKNNIEKYLKQAEANGKTVTDVINESGIGRTSFYDIKAGKQIPKLNTAIQIAKALGANAHDVFPDLKEVS